MTRRAFIIRPIRNAPLWVGHLVELYKSANPDIDFYDPLVDTTQDQSSLGVCQDNLRAIEACDEVHFFWDGESNGCMFDLGAAFALGKEIIPVEVPDETEGKSFQNMVSEYARIYL